MLGLDVKAALTDSIHDRFLYGSSLSRTSNAKWASAAANFSPLRKFSVKGELVKRSRIDLAKQAVGLALCCLLSAMPLSANGNEGGQTATPIKHVVVIFQENISFDHYFGTYPNAVANKDGSVYFAGPLPFTPRVNNLVSAGLLTNNPNGVNPFRIDRSNPNTCDQDHGYGDEQYAFHGGLMDRFLTHSCNDTNLGPNSTMGYYDGNTVTALWNYAQHYAMSDNSFGTSFGPSTPGLLNQGGRHDL